MDTKDVILKLRTEKGLSQDELIDFCAEHMSNENWSSEQVRAHMKELLPKLNHWKQINQ